MSVMTIGTQASAGVFADTGIYYDKKFLERLKPQLYLKDIGEKRPLPTRSGTLVKWHRLDKQSAATTPLTEGSNPSEGSVSTSVVSAEPATYGAFVKVSTELNLQAINPVVEEIVDEQGDQAALTYDTLVRNALHNNGTNQFAAGAATELLTSAVASAAELRKAVYKLRSATGGAIPGFEGNLYKAVIHPATEFDFLSESATGAFIDVTKYTTKQPIMQGEIGTLWGVRIMVSPNIGTGSGVSSATTYRNFVFGRGAYGVTELSGMGVKTLRQGPGGNADPLEMFSTLGWKFRMAAKVLQSTRFIEIYACTNAA